MNSAQLRKKISNEYRQYANIRYESYLRWKDLYNRSTNPESKRLCRRSAIAAYSDYNYYKNR